MPNMCNRRKSFSRGTRLEIRRLAVVPLLFAFSMVQGCAKDEVEAASGSAEIPAAGIAELNDWLGKRVMKIEDFHSVTHSHQFINIEFESDDRWTLPRAEPWIGKGERGDMADFKWLAEALPIREAERRNGVTHSFNIRFLASAVRITNTESSMPWLNLKGDALHSIWLVQRDKVWTVYHSNEGDWAHIEEQKSKE
ncbi:MAG: hypothetical protein ACI8UO_005797 [Verrucomicrobiales bacterium]|jgi:hypothetical protein